MIGINSTFNNSFVNLNIKNNNNSSLNSNTNVKNLQDTQDTTKTSNKVLGYEVDNEGYFTSEFNKAAGIPEDIKIHSSTMESLVKISTNEKNPLRAFESIDIAKTVGNAYKILSQVVGKDVLNSKDSFSLEEIANFPQGYEFNRQSMQVTKIYNSATDYLNADIDFDYKNTMDTKINKLFFNTTENLMKGNPATDIFNNNNKENINTGVFFDTTPSKYTNKDGTITKGGLLVAIINENIYTREGEATHQGKTEGFDKSMSGEEVKKAWNDRNYNLKLNPNNIVQGAGIVDTNNENIEFTPLIEIMQKEQKELIKYLQRKQKIDITI
ncbi:hypothetical protein AAID92_08475 [Campylobacter coli]